MAIKAISQFDAATPTSSDKILFEQNGEGKSTALADLPISTKTQAALDTKINKTDSLTLEEIMASTDLSGKVTSASALNSFRKLQDIIITEIYSNTDITKLNNGLYFITGPYSPINGVQGAYNTLYIINDYIGWRNEIALCANLNSIYFRSYHKNQGIEDWGNVFQG